MLENEKEIFTEVKDLWAKHQDEVRVHDATRSWVRGERGTPDVPESASAELKNLAVLSRKNILRRVRDEFAAPLTVVGYRAATESKNAEVWKQWQAQRLDARQGEVHRSAVTYGTGYVITAGHPDGKIRVRSPRQLFAGYVDPHTDTRPTYALETWVDASRKEKVRKGRLFDDTHVYPLDLGTVRQTTNSDGDAVGVESTQPPVSPKLDGTPYEHGLDRCPVVRFVNHRDSEDLVEGEVEPLIPSQKALNEVNFDRLVVARYGAFPQKYVIGWTPASKSELIEASIQRLMTFDDDNVKAGTFTAAAVTPYNEIILEQLVAVAMDAHLPPFALTGNFANLAADSIALLRKPYEDKLNEKRLSFGESWEDVLRDLGDLASIEVPDEAEVIWAESEARSYAQVVDGVSKLQAAGVPIDQLLEDIPGWTQQRVDAAAGAVRRAAARQALGTVLPPVPAAPAPAEPAVN